MNATQQNKSRKAKAQTLEPPPSEIIIERRYSIWGIVQGSHFTELHDQNGQVFYDPMLASKYISATTQGHVRVLWNL